MNIIIAFFLLLTIGCTTDNNQPKKTNQIVENNVSKLIDKGFEINLEMENEEETQYSLVVSIALDSGCYVVSPYSKDDTYGHFDISIADSSHFMAYDTLLETPQSVEEFDSILNEPVKFVRGYTTYKQKVRLLSKNDFKVSGLIWFVLEPRCVPYEVEFVISYSSGQMKIKKAYMRITNQPNKVNFGILDIGKSE